MLTVSTLGACGDLERTVFEQFPFCQKWCSWKNWYLTVSTLPWCDGLNRTDF